MLGSGVVSVGVTSVVVSSSTRKGEVERVERVVVAVGGVAVVLAIVVEVTVLVVGVEEVVVEVEEVVVEVEGELVEVVFSDDVGL